jgi:hypothetical protein
MSGIPIPEDLKIRMSGIPIPEDKIMSGIPDLLLCDVCRISLILAPAHLLHGCHHRLSTDIFSFNLKMSSLI